MCGDVWLWATVFSHLRGMRDGSDNQGKCSETEEVRGSEGAMKTGGMRKLTSCLMARREMRREQGGATGRRSQV
jgi:hypothetical protein